MGIVIRQSLKASIISYIGAFIGYLNVVFILPVCLPREIIGLSRLFVDMGAFLTFIVQLGMSTAVVRFFPYFKNEKDNNGFFFLVVMIPFFGFILFSILFFFFKNYIILYFHANSEIFTHYIYYLLPLTFFISYHAIFEAYASCLLRITVPRLIRDVILKLLNILIIILFYYKIFTLTQFITGIVAIYAIAMFLNLYYLIRIGNISWKPNFNFLNKPLIKEIGKYILYIMIGGLTGSIVNKVDVFMISASINLVNTGIFSIAFYIATVIDIPLRSVLQISNPLVSEAVKKNDLLKVDNLYKQSSLNLFIMGSFILLVVWINVDNIYLIMPNGHLYTDGKYVILFLGLAKLFDMITGVNGLIFSNSKLYFYQLFFILYLTIVSVGLNAILIPKFGIVGAGIAALIGIATYNLLMVAFLKIKMKIQPFTISTLKAIAVFITPLILNYILPVAKSPILDGLYRTIVLSFLFLFLLLFFKVSDDINDIWKKIQDKSFFRELFSTFKF